jgi:selenocysteine lyase/cysteine desulfurase
VNVGVGEGAGKIAKALYERDVCVDARAGGIRISPHFFNTEEDVDRCFDALAELL